MPARSRPHSRSRAHSRARLFARFTPPHAAMAVMAVMLATLALTGGSSRYDVPGLVLLRPVLALAAGLLAVLPAPDDRTLLRAPLVLLALLAGTIAVQLVPLPPALWTALPGRGRYLLAATLAGAAEQPWRPISIVPVLTLNALLALMPAAAMLVGFGRLDRRGQRLVVPALLLLAAASALLGILQLGMGGEGSGGGGGGGAYLYARTVRGLPVGLFANRNHQAALLAGSLPLLAAWITAGGRATGGAPRSRRPAAGAAAVRIAVAVAGTLLALLVILASGSRSGLLLAVVGLTGAAWVMMGDGGTAAGTQAPVRRWRRAGGGLRLSGGVGLAAGLGLAALLVAVVAAWSGRGSGFGRFLALNEPGAEMRFLAWPVLRRLAVDYLPWGSGFGTFDPLFRLHEPDRLLKPTYFNNAHNDLLELAITGGVPALLVLAAFLGWFGWRVRAVSGSQAIGGGEVAEARAGAVLLAVLLLASLSDYPLRTPLAGAVAALAAGLLQRGARAAGRVQLVRREPLR